MSKFVAKLQLDKDFETMSSDDAYYMVPELAW